jgi:hypothetical protein
MPDSGKPALTPVGPPEDNGTPPPLTRRILWFVALAVASAAAIAIAAYMMRALLRLTSAAES